MSRVQPGSLAGIRVIEIGDEQSAYCGLTLAGLGAEVVKIESPDGCPTRRIGPYLDDEADPERSLFFWANNRAKKSVVLDLEGDGAPALHDLLSSADVFLDASPVGSPAADGLDRDSLLARYPALVVARITPFGEDGPWARYRGSDLVHLALGGPLMNCGYDPLPDGTYDLPPMAPQAFESYAVAGEQLALAIVGALVYRERSGRGQYVSLAIHEAVAKSTETDLMGWVVQRQLNYRQTCRHSGPVVANTLTIAHTKDGRWLNVISIGGRDRNRLVQFLERYGMAEGLTADAETETGARSIPGTTRAASDNIDLVQKFVRRFTFDNLPWEEMQEAGVLCAPVRKPHENAIDEHWLQRGTFTDIEHPEVGRAFRYPTSKWVATGSSWQAGRRAPLLGEDTDAVLGSPLARVELKPRTPPAPEPTSVHGKPWALHGVKVFDFAWFLASAGGTRFLAALGADVIKVEWKDHPDTRGGSFPAGGREERLRATAPLKLPPGGNLGGQFNNKNPGKRGISLNVGHPKGKEMAREFIRQCDIVTEGFSPGVFERWGFGWDALREINQRIIYVQQSGMGQGGRYGRFRAVGPIAGSLSGLTEMGGLPEPALPTGWGYSYLDWLGAYSFGLAVLTAIYQREVTGEGQWIDASQSEVGIFTSATTILDWSANGRLWQRVGNRSPYAAAAPQGVYRCAGDDRWVAITCASDDDWQALAKVADHPEWAADSRFATVASRMQHHDAIDELVEGWTRTLDAYDAMGRIQGAGVAAGVAQTAEDRCDHDPQLAHLEWLTEVPNTDIGTWPVAEAPFDMSETPPYAGGRIQKGAPIYGEHNYEVYEEFLGLSRDEVDALAEEGVV